MTLNHNLDLAFVGFVAYPRKRFCLIKRAFHPGAFPHNITWKTAAFETIAPAAMRMRRLPGNIVMNTPLASASNIGLFDLTCFRAVNHCFTQLRVKPHQSLRW